MVMTVSSTFIWGVIIGMAALNFAVRFVPIAVVSRMEIPAPLMRWLSFIPISVMGALVSLDILWPGGTFASPLTSPYVWAAIPSALVYWRTRSFLGATVAGVVAFVALGSILG